MLSIGVPAMRMISVTFALSSVTMVLGYAMSGLGNGMVNMLGTGLRQLVLLVPLAYLFASKFGVEQVWFAMWISECAAMLYAIWATKRTMRSKMNG
jgi:Na+-driven multidrug efflux pump